MMFYPWRTYFPWRKTFSTGAWILLGHPRRGLESNGIVIFARGVEDESASTNAKTAGNASSIIIGVLFCLFLVSIIGLAVFYFFKRRRQRSGDMESEPEKRRGNWWMHNGDKESKVGGIVEWWRQSHSIPDRVEPPPSATTGQRWSLQRLKSAISNKKSAALLSAIQSDKQKRGHERKPSDLASLLPKPFGPKASSPTQTIVLPLQTVPQPQPRYPSVLERGYRVPLYPSASPPQSNSPPRSLTTPKTSPPERQPSLPEAEPHPQEIQSAHPITVAERQLRRKKISPPPRALKIANGRPLVPISERKMGLPRSPAHRQRRGLMNQFKHPFLPLKDSDTAFPTISAPMPSAESGLTNPKLNYSYGSVNPAQVPRSAPMAPGGPRQLIRSTTRRIPAPIMETKPSRPLMPATPLHLRERVLPPGSPSVPRSVPPTPI